MYILIYLIVTSNAVKIILIVLNLPGYCTAFHVYFYRSPSGNSGGFAFTSGGGGGNGFVMGSGFGGGAPDRGFVMTSGSGLPTQIHEFGDAPRGEKKVFRDGNSQGTFFRCVDLIMFGLRI